MNIISLYCNKTCINYASFITIYRLIVILNCRLNYGSSVDAAGGRGNVEQINSRGDGCRACNIDGICRTDL